MSKTAEAIERARAYIEKTDAEMGSLWTETDNEIAEVLVGFSNRESSSKDARIKELEVQISGKTFFDEKETMAAKIQELEARLETANYLLAKSSDDNIEETLYQEINAFLTNKKELYE